MIVLLLAAVAAGAYWAGTQSRRYPPNEVSRRPAAGRGPGGDIGDGPTPRRTSAPTWPWVLGMVLTAVLILGITSGPGGVFGGPGPLGGPGGPFAPVFGP